MNVLALFAGIGGLELGVGLAVRGARTVCYVEREAYAAACLVARMEDEALAPAPVWDDVTTFDGRPWRGVVDCIAGGFPCQDVSVANHAGKGLDGERSGLWREFARIIREVEPRYVFVENVPQLTRRGLDRVLGDLAELGFDAEWDVFSAAGVGAPHLRRRIFILAQRLPDAERDGVRQQPERGVRSARPTDARHALARDMGVEEMSNRRGGRSAPMGDTDSRRREVERLEECPGKRSASGDESDGHGEDRRLVWPPGPLDDAGWRDWLAAGGAEPGIRRGADGLPARVDRLRCLGNGVVPAVAARAWRVLEGRLNVG